MTLRSNPRILILFFVILAMFAVSVVGFIFLAVLYGVIFLVIALFLSYQFTRFGLSHLKSRIRTDENGVAFHMPSNEDERFEWEELSHTGYCTPAKGRAFAFVYCQERDRLITVPPEYERFDEFVSELKRRPGFSRFELGRGETIQTKLSDLLGLTKSGDAVDGQAESEMTEVSKAKDDDEE